MPITTETRYEDLSTLLTPSEFFLWAKIKKTKGYELLRDGSIRSVRFGKSIRIPRESLKEFIDRGGTEDNAK